MFVFVYLTNNIYAKCIEMLIIYIPGMDYMPIPSIIVYIYETEI
jgi:hypothetical protein